MRIYTKVVWQWEDGVLVEKEAHWYEYFGPVTLAKTNPFLVGNHFRFRDGGTDTVDSTPTWLAGEDTNVNIDVSSGNIKLRLRFAVQETGGADDSAAPYTIRSSIDAYAAGLTTSSTGIRCADVSSSADNTAINTSRLTGSGTFVTGQYDETGSSANITLLASRYTEVEFGLELVAADLTDGQIIDLRCYRSASPLDSYAVTPRITVSKNPAFGSHIGSAGLTIASLSSFTTNEKVTVAVGDLVVVIIGGNHSSYVASSVSDSLSNSWTPLNDGYAMTNASIRGWFSIITTAGDMTVTGTFPVAQALGMTVDVFEGPFASSPLDKTPLPVFDSSTPHTSNTTGTLSQADELVVGYIDNRSSTAVNATSPYVLLNRTVGNSLAQVALESQVVSVTTEQTASFGGGGTNESVVGIATFKKEVVAPDTPTGLTATAISSSRIDLSWSAAGTGGTPTGYQIERETPIGGGWGNLVANTATTDTTYPDTSCAAETQYNYRVSALNSAGNSAPSTAAANTTPEAAADIGLITGLPVGPPYF